ncbi:MAG: hypothetical protein QM519_02355 [Bacteroidia bacterium]|nr:hypothetical protein [Bacteroidia bacterium]
MLPITETEALTTTCPKCKAGIGTFCTADGKRRRRLHAERFTAKRTLKSIAKRLFF